MLTQRKVIDGRTMAIFYHIINIAEFDAYMNIVHTIKL